MEPVPRQQPSASGAFRARAEASPAHVQGGNEVHQVRRSGGSGREDPTLAEEPCEAGDAVRDPDGDGEPTVAVDSEVARLRSVASGASAWVSPPELRGVDDGIPDHVERLHALGNAVVPQCAEVIGLVIKNAGFVPAQQRTAA